MARKSKTQLQYEKLRKYLLNARSREVKKGSHIYIDLPYTPIQQAKAEGRKASVKDYQRGLKDLKRVKEWYEDVSSTSDDIPDASEIIIDNFIKGIEVGEGGIIIQTEVRRFIDKYGSQRVAQALEEMKQDGYVINKPEVYRKEAALRYIAQMGSFLMRSEVVTPEEYMKFEDELYGRYDEEIPEELQIEFFEEWGLL